MMKAVALDFKRAPVVMAGVLVLDAAGHPVVSYYDYTIGDPKLLHCGDPTCKGAAAPPPVIIISPTPLPTETPTATPPATPSVTPGPTAGQSPVMLPPAGGPPVGSGDPGALLAVCGALLGVAIAMWAIAWPRASR